MPEEKKRGGGGLSCLGIGCGALVLLAIGGVALVYVKGGDWMRSAGAYTMEKSAETLFEGLQIPEEERRAALDEVRSFGDRIRNDEVSMEQAGAVIQVIGQGPLPYMILTRAFEVRFVAASDLSEEEKARAHVTVTRFAHGLSEGAIPKEKGEAVMDIVMEPTPGNPDQKRLKESITPEELDECLVLMREAADEGGVAQKAFDLDLAAAIREAIQAGLSGATPAGASGTTAPTTPDAGATD